MANTVSIKWLVSVSPVQILTARENSSKNCVEECIWLANYYKITTTFCRIYKLNTCMFKINKIEKGWV